MSRSLYSFKLFTLYRSSDDSMCLLEVVMSQPMLRDVKKAECTSVMGLVGVKPIEVVVNDGIKGKQSDSDNDERGLLLLILFL